MIRDVATCGDTAVDSWEQCDDGNAVNTDACKNVCTMNVCGGGIVETGSEDCDVKSTPCAAQGEKRLDPESRACRDAPGPAVGAASFAAGVAAAFSPSRAVAVVNNDATSFKAKED